MFYTFTLYMFLGNVKLTVIRFYCEDLKKTNNFFSKSAILTVRQILTLKQNPNNPNVYRRHLNSDNRCSAL